MNSFPNVKTVPYIIVGNNHLGGYKQLLEFLGEPDA
jgi:glutaredoxin